MAEAAERRQGSSSAGSLRVHTERLHQRRQVMGSLDTEHHALAGDDARHVEIHQPAAAVPPCTADRVNINVTRIITGHSRVFGVKGTQKLAKLMRTYRVHEEREGRTMPEVALTTYLYNGRAVLAAWTRAGLEPLEPSPMAKAKGEKRPIDSLIASIWDD